MKLSRNRYFSLFDNIHEWIIFILKNEKKNQILRNWKKIKLKEIENYESLLKLKILKWIVKYTWNRMFVQYSSN